MNLIRKLLLLLSAVIVLAAGSPVEFKAFDTEIAPLVEDIEHRLNDDVIPLKYELELTPYFVNVRSMTS